MLTTRLLLRTFSVGYNSLCEVAIRSNLFSIRLISSFQCCLPNSVDTVIKRHFSRRPRKLENLSDIEELIERDFALDDLQKKLDEENLPALVTTSSLLEGCQSVDDVLLEIQNAVQGGKLWEDEFVIYIDALVKVMGQNKMDPVKRLTPENRLQVMKELMVDESSVSNRRKFLNDSYFQFLIKEVLLHSSRLTTFDLTSIFHSLVVLQIPSFSSVMSLLVGVIQNRINELFPADVARCFAAIHKISHQHSKQINSLYDGLLMHLENQVLDEPTFVRILTQTPLIHQIKLLRHSSMLGSKKLKKTLYHSMGETVKRRPGRRLHGMHEASALLVALAASKLEKPYFMLAIATKYFTENEKDLKYHHRKLIRTALGQMRLTNDRALHGMRALSH